MENYINEFLNKLAETLTKDDMDLILEDTDETINIYDEKYFDTYIYKSGLRKTQGFNPGMNQSLKYIFLIFSKLI